MPSATSLLELARSTGPLAVATDADLLARYIADRDEAAFAEIVRRNGPNVLRACRTIAGPDAAEDAFQAVFLLLARKAARITRPGSLAGWLHAVAVRTARTARRSAARRRKHEANAVPLATPDEMRGRVTAVDMIFIGTSNEFGQFESGLTAQWFGTVHAVVFGGIGTLLVVGLWAWLFPDLRNAGDLNLIAAASTKEDAAEEIQAKEI